MINKDIDTATVTDRHQYAVAVLCDAETADQQQLELDTKVREGLFTFETILTLLLRGGAESV